MLVFKGKSEIIMVLKYGMLVMSIKQVMAL